MRLSIRSDGTYRIDDYQGISQLYFPLFNLHGMKSAITPTLHGDAKVDQHHYAMIPASGIDLMQPLNARNVYFVVDGELWNVSGQTPWQKRNPDLTRVEYGLQYQRVLRRQTEFSVETTSFVPIDAVFAEVHQLVFTNTSNRILSVQPTTGIAIYGRSADNLRDHRHVTSLLNRGHVVDNGIINIPTMSFDERGHRLNRHCYGVFAFSSLHEKPTAYHPEYDDFVGEGGDLFYPDKALKLAISRYAVGDVASGLELVGGLAFAPVALQPGASLHIHVIIGIDDDRIRLQDTARQYGNTTAFTRSLAECLDFWRRRTPTKAFTLRDGAFSGWLRHVGMQPLLRRLFGNSFLPHHDYGRGGRGWRDLWQDSLEPIYEDAATLRDNLLSYLGGVRVDGSNATIIGERPGDFLADRNRIVRIWSDHGAWPIQTISRYIDWTGDLDFLFAETSYFKDRLIAYAKAEDAEYQPAQGEKQLEGGGNVYLGSALEHLLVQNLVPFFNIGDHGNIRIEDADWNDGFDMAAPEGETVAFTHLYAANFRLLVRYLEVLQTQGITEIPLFAELTQLLDLDETAPDYSQPRRLRQRLARFFESVAHTLMGTKINVGIGDLIRDLRRKADHFITHLQTNEWLVSEDGETAFFNGYYDALGKRLEHPDHPVEMTLTGQTFALLSQTADPKMARMIHHAVGCHLADHTSGSLRLNTDFGRVDDKLGRFTGFAYGHKENGALFSHMAIMYVYGLMVCGLDREGIAIIERLYAYLLDLERSRILPGIPEYLDASGRGMYPFLTGSASWFYLLLVEQVFGVRGHLGDILLQPKIPAEWFVAGEAALNVGYAGKLREFRFRKPEAIGGEPYRIGRIILSTIVIPVHSQSAILRRAVLADSSQIVIELEATP